MCNYSLDFYGNTSFPVNVSLVEYAQKAIIDIALSLLSQTGSIVAAPDTAARLGIYGSAGYIVAVPDTATRLGIHGSAGYIVTAPDTATEAIYIAVRHIRFGRVYRNRTGYCNRSHMQCATLYTLRYAMSNCPAPWSGPGFIMNGLM